MFIVVQKRGNTRFFYRDPNSNNFRNAPMGTVVDNTITGRKINNVEHVDNMFDFYLVSQSANQGTVSPSHFRVLADDLNFRQSGRIDRLQILTFMLSHMYFNWPVNYKSSKIEAVFSYIFIFIYMLFKGQIKVPAPCNLFLCLKYFYLKIYYN